MYPENIKPFCLFISGPTASGKTAVSLLLAAWLGAEIISADSRQIYKGMRIGTAMPTEKELRSVKHYFVNERNPDEPFSAGEFGMLTRKIIDQKIEAGRSVIVCGGSGLYIQAVLGMISDRLKSDSVLRTDIGRRAQKEGWDVLYRELQSMDPAYAESIDPRNPKRIARALEIVYLSHGKHSKKMNTDAMCFPHPKLHIGLEIERGQLYRRINERVLSMIDAGWVEEVRQLLEKGYTPDMNALNTVGYKEIIAYLQGTYDLDKAVSEIQKHTRHFAKRQMTWFRKYAPDIRIDVNDQTPPASTAEQIKKHIWQTFGE
ncbi:MAG: tRNA (adenosine(37)-N6)-dimethylallyltransferase MiaA [FCB group bacterium]|nr:tRNA (adenosine(37)-N6)-dimethylallyltransferase MiaA [FCB group bacterium]